MSTATFLGTLSADWTNTANWQNLMAARPGDRVTISANAAIAAGTYTYGNSTLMNASLTMQPATAISFSQITVKNGAITGGAIEGTELYVYGATSVENTVLQSDVVSGSLLAADVGVSGYLTTLDNYYGPGGVWITHQLTVAGSASLLGNGITLQNATVAFAAGAAAGSLTVGDDATLDVASGTGAAASVIAAGSLVNQGTIDIEAGATLQVAAALSGAGSLLVETGGTLDLDGAAATAALAGVGGGGQMAVGGVLNDSGSVLDLSTLTGVNWTFGDAAGGGRINGGTLRPAGYLFQASASAAPTVLYGVAVQGLLDLAGSVELTDGTSFANATGGAGGAVKLENGTLLLDGYTSFSGASIELVTGRLAATAPTQLAPGVQLAISGNAQVDGSVTVDGTIAVGNGDTVSLGDGSTTTTTTTTLGKGSTVKAIHKVAGTTQFGGSLGTLELTGTGSLSATIGGFVAGDAVRLDGLTAGTLSLSGTTLTVSGNGTTATLALAGGGTAPYALGDFQLAAGPGGALVLTTTHVAAGSDNPLFDRAYYMAQYGAQVAASGLDAWQHYLQIGAKAGLNPNAWFDTSFYLKQNPSVAASGVNPLLQYEQTGWRTGGATSLLFSGTAYWAANPGMAGTDPLIDLMQSGAGSAASYAPGQGGSADPLVQASYLFAQMGATLLPSANAAAIATALYKSGGWTAMVNPDPLFDTTFYMNTHRAEVLASGLDPLTHYETIGWREGYDPSLMFSTSAYLAARPGAASAGVDPLTATFNAAAAAQHAPDTVVAQSGASAAPAVDPLLDTAGVARQIATLLPAGGADPAAVAKAYSEGAWQAVSQPNPLFNSAFYLAQNPDVAAAGIDPLAHYEAHGASEGRNPDPLFNTNYYLTVNRDVAAAGVNPLMHFETNGWREGRNPDALFNVNYYLAHNPTVAAAQIDPLVDFENGGWQAGRNPDALFDVKYYLAHNPDVAAAGIDPLVHYDEFGWKEGRNPSASFNTQAYLAANPDVKAAGVDPLAQYLSAGINEGRAIYAVH